MQFFCLGLCLLFYTDCIKVFFNEKTTVTFIALKNEIMFKKVQIFDKQTAKIGFTLNCCYSFILYGISYLAHFGLILHDNSNSSNVISGMIFLDC